MVVGFIAASAIIDASANPGCDDTQSQLLLLVFQSYSDTDHNSACCFDDAWRWQEERDCGDQKLIMREDDESEFKPAT